MADSMMTYAIAAGTFAFLAAIVFGTRVARKRSHGEMITSEGKGSDSD